MTEKTSKLIVRLKELGGVNYAEAIEIGYQAFVSDGGGSSARFGRFLRTADPNL